MLIPLLTLAGALLAAATLPLAAELALVTFADIFSTLYARSKPPLAGAEAPLAIAVIVPAHNEAALIVPCVASLRAAATPRTRVIVVAHNCSDETAANARAAGAEVLVYDSAERGKGHALRHGFSHALSTGSDAVLVVDADSTVSHNLILAVEHALSAGTEVVQCRYEMDSPAGPSNKPNARIAALAIRGFNRIRPRGRQSLGLSTGILGNGFAIRRDVLAAIPYEAFSVVEDLEYHIHLVMAGKRVQFLDHAVVSSDLPASREGENVQRSRWEGGRFNTARVWVLPLLRQILRGRLRLIEPLLDLLGLPLAYGVFLLLLALCIPLAWVRIYALAALVIVLCHVLAAACAGPDIPGTLRLLLLAPFYILWKLRLIPKILRGSKSQAAWVRTTRDTRP